MTRASLATRRTKPRYWTPQQRVFLECAWSALEDSGYALEDYTGSVGLFAGSSFSQYLLHILSQRGVATGVDDYVALAGNDKDFLATRTAYKLNLKGPAMATLTACSTGLTAVSMAIQSLLSYQCDLAMAGAVAIAFPQQRGYEYVEGGIFSPDGHCRAFDAQAQGTVPGSGVGVVVLKRLDEALQDHDVIHAVIKGYAINNDGMDKVGFTAPSVKRQADVIATAHAIAGVSPDSISYVETHGTATPLGDPIEMAALVQVFGGPTTNQAQQHVCAIGSVKTNIGHLDAASGMAGLIKTILALKHQQLLKK